jgi:FGGY-family pentulose kinase
MDHRASQESFKINQTSHKVLDFVGGKISLEMQTPKLLWLKNHLKEECYSKTQEFFDLPDFLRWKATGSLKRSICSIVCKWTHINSPVEGGNYWDSSYFREIGLEDVLPKIGSTFSFPGGQDSDTLCPQAVEELGLHSKVKVGYSMIDADSGVLGMVGCKIKNEEGIKDITKRLALICGTSNCHMALSTKPCSVPGVWGPYYGVIFPHLYLNEGGQSAAGKLLDHIVSSHPAYPKLLKGLGDNHG